MLQLTERSPLVPPRLIHYKPKARRREQIDAKDHRASATPHYLTKELSKAPDAARAYDHMPAGEPPSFHEIRPSDGCTSSKLPTGVHSGVDGACEREDDEALSGGARRKEDRVPGGKCRIGVLSWEFFKSHTTKKGPPFGEPF